VSNVSADIEEKMCQTMSKTQMFTRKC